MPDLSRLSSEKTATPSTAAAVTVPDRASGYGIWRLSACTGLNRIALVSEVVGA